MDGSLKEATDMGASGKRPPPANPYEVVTEDQLKMYGLTQAVRIDIPTKDPMLLDQVATVLEELAGKLRRGKSLALTQPPHLVLLGAGADIRSAHVKIKAISKCGKY